MTIRASIAVALLGLVAGAGCSSGTAGPASQTPAAHTMTFAECQASAEYPGGGRYAVEFDNGVCTVQRP